MTPKSLEEIPNSIWWHEGMRMSPKMIQDSFLRAVDLIHFRMSNLSPYAYGIINLDIAKESLSHNLFQINQLECIMPDGLEIYYTQSYESKKNLELNLNPFIEQVQKGPQKIYLCVPHGDQITPTNAKLSRYYVESNKTAVEIYGEKSTSIACYKPNISLQLGTTPPPDYISMPIALINFDKNKFELNDYTPPLFNVKKGSEIYAHCEDILRILKVKCDILIEQHKKSFIDHENSNHKISKFIDIIRQIIPKLDFVLSARFIAPFNLYLEMISVYGQIICLDQSYSKDSIPQYDHENILENFQILTKMICEPIEVEVPDHFSLCYLEKYQDYYRSTTNLPINTEDLTIGFRKPDSFSDSDFHNFIKSLLICEKNNLSAMREVRSLGFDRHHIKSQTGLFLSKNIYLYSIDVGGEQIQKNSEIVVFSSTNDFQNLEKNSIILYNKVNLKND